MPIEIKELIIKMTISEKLPERLPAHAELSSTVKDKLVKECTEKVLRKLESKIER